MTNSTTRALEHHPAAPLPPAAVAALHRLELAFAPPLMQFPTAAGATVSVHSDGSDRTPYTWTCTAGHEGGHAYASLPFCRDDAKAHAAEFPGASPEIERAVVRYGVCTATYARLTMQDRLTPAEFDLLADAQDELTRLHEQLEQAGMLHLVVAS